MSEKHASSRCISLHWIRSPQGQGDRATRSPPPLLDHAPGNCYGRILCTNCPAWSWLQGVCVTFPRPFLLGPTSLPGWDHLKGGLEAADCWVWVGGWSTHRLALEVPESKPGTGREAGTDGMVGWWGETGVIILWATLLRCRTLRSSSILNLKLSFHVIIKVSLSR